MEAALRKHVTVLEKLLEEQRISYPKFVPPESKRAAEDRSRSQRFSVLPPPPLKKLSFASGWDVVRKKLQISNLSASAVSTGGTVAMSVGVAGAADMPPPPPPLPLLLIPPPELPPAPPRIEDVDATPPPPPPIQQFQGLLMKVGPKEECPTLDDAMRRLVICEARGSHITIELSGLHVIHSSLKISSGNNNDTDADADADDVDDLELLNTLEIPFSNIKIVGDGQEATTIVGMLVIDNVQNIVVENLTLTNPKESSALTVINNGDIQVEFCQIHRCGKSAVYCFGGAVRMNKCRIHHNSDDAIYADGKLSRVLLVNTAIIENRKQSLHALNGAHIDVVGRNSIIERNVKGIRAYGKNTLVRLHHTTKTKELDKKCWIQSAGGKVECAIPNGGEEKVGFHGTKVFRKVTLIPSNSEWSLKANEVALPPPPPRCSMFMNVSDITTVVDVSVLRVGPTHAIKCLRQAMALVKHQLEISTILVSGFHVLEEDEENVEEEENEEEEQDIEATNVLNISRSNINIIGEDDTASIVGTIKITNKNNVKLEKIRITSPDGPGLWLRGTNCEVEAFECIFGQSTGSGVHAEDGCSFLMRFCEFHRNRLSGMTVCRKNTKGDFEDCFFHHNVEHGLHVYDQAEVNIHGDGSTLYCNGKYGLLSWSEGQVHLHVTSKKTLCSGNGVLDIKGEDDSCVVNDVLVF